MIDPSTLCVIGFSQKVVRVSGHTVRQHNTHFILLPPYILLLLYKNEKKRKFRSYTSYYCRHRGSILVYIFLTNLVFFFFCTFGNSSTFCYMYIYIFFIAAEVYNMQCFRNFSHYILHDFLFRFEIFLYKTFLCFIDHYLTTHS